MSPALEQLPEMSDEPLVDIRGLARYLGVSHSTVRKWSAQGPASGRLPRALRINGQIRFRPADVREWVAAKELR